MAKGDNTSKQSDSEKIAGLEKQLEKIEHTNAVLQDKVDSIGDPGKEIKIVRKGYTKSSIKFQKNNIRIHPITGERIDPSNPIPAE